MTDYPADYPVHPDYPVHKLCNAIHQRTNLYEADIKHWLRDLAELKEQGFSPETTPMLQLFADTGILRQLANALDEQRKQLTQPEPLNENI
jgi:hypothetical protein